MASSRQIKKRIRSTKNIAQITKAMEAVSAVKMRKSQEIALRSRAYSLAAFEILKNLVGGFDLENLNSSSLLKSHESKKTCLVVVTSDKGLCGAFSGNVLRAANNFIKSRAAGTVDVIAVGKKGADFCVKRGVNLAEKITGTGDYGAIDETKFLSDLISELYSKGEYGEIYAVYTNFLSVIKQEVVLEKILPFTQEGIEKRINEIIPLQGKYTGTPEVLGKSKGTRAGYIFEPSPEEALTKLLPLLLEIQIYHIILEANASEHSARMVAMKNASDNASELIDNLELVYNKARQTQITRELTEIVSGAAALEN